MASPSQFGQGVLWTPKFPDIAVTDRGLPGAAVPEDSLPESTAAGLDWVDAPGDSHLHSFSLEGFRQVRRMGALASIASRGESRIRVRFKPKKSGGAVAEYEYLFTSHDEAVRYFGKMIGHPDPGEVVWEMIRAGVPYRAVRR
jgi:hypothetical protein